MAQAGEKYACPSCGLEVQVTKGSKGTPNC